MADTYNLRDLIAKANAHEDEGSGGDFLTSTLAGGTLANGKYNVKIKHVKVIDSNNFGLPGFKLVCEFLDGEHKGEVMWVDSDLTTFDFVNKRVLANLRALGINDNLLEQMDRQGELIASMLKGKETEITVKFTENKKDARYPRANHTFKPTELDIPEYEADDDDDY